jgi:hypothetical protein
VFGVRLLTLFVDAPIVDSADRKLSANPPKSLGSEMNWGFVYVFRSKSFSKFYQNEQEGIRIEMTEADILPELKGRLVQFLDYVGLERGLADNTAEAYKRDSSRYLVVLTDLGVEKFEVVTQSEVSSLINLLGDVALESSSLARNLTTVRMFHRLLFSEGYTLADPTEHFKPPNWVANCKEVTRPSILGPS